MRKSTMIRTYSELLTIPSFEERFRYLKLSASVGSATFGYDRYLNQKFYKSKEWRQLRNQIITRDSGYDMALEGYEIRGRIIIHHLNPIVESDISDVTDNLLNPEYLVCVSNDTHNAIHYGDEDLIRAKTFVQRRPNDTCPWRE